VTVSYSHAKFLGNEHTFEIDDLKKLIVKTGEDLAEADRQRTDEFKQYELQKEFEKQEKMRGMNDEEKKKFEEDVKKMTEKHNKHEKVHHPGSKDQLEEVWEKQDGMVKNRSCNEFILFY
jgi:nucleobindin